ncbi:hypothetical protein MRB53_042172 [Persea americana]|nr:hypothetical protein MRB53_042172 [Persea americana]
MPRHRRRRLQMRKLTAQSPRMAYKVRVQHRRRPFHVCRETGIGARLGWIPICQYYSMSGSFQITSMSDIPLHYTALLLTAPFRLHHLSAVRSSAASADPSLPPTRSILRTTALSEVQALEAFAQLAARAAPDAPDGYTPSSVACPSARPSIRSASSLSEEETNWLGVRRPNTLGPMSDLLTRMNITGFDAGAYISRYTSNVTQLPNIAIAASGGGYRALQNGAGGLAAFDNRTTNSTNAGQLGGLLQSATYLAGLSGGAWLVGSIYANNFTSVESSMSITRRQAPSPVIC